MLADNFQLVAIPFDLAEHLKIWTITRHPTDYRQGYVARMSLVGRVTGVTDHMHLAPTLQAVRCKLPEGLICFDRSPSDHPDIVETWM